MLRLASAALALTLAGTAQAQDQLDMIVVTGSRIADFEMDMAPHVTLVRRADAMAMTVVLECDTRDLSDRERELRATLRNLHRAAERDANFDLGLIVEVNDRGDEQVLPFTPDMIEEIPLSRGGRPDTSRLTISLVSPVQAGEDYSDLTARFDRFRDGVALVGRSQFQGVRDTNLTVSGGPARYRDELVAAIAEDARAIAARFGEGSSLELSGLEGAVRWQQAGPLSLRLYIDYELSVTPHGAQR